MQYKVMYSCTSHIGNIRAINQDNYFCDGQYMAAGHPAPAFPLCGANTSAGESLFGIFDGMGGEECGEIASLIAAKNAAVLSIGTDPINALKQFCQNTNTDICTYVAENGLSSMGTTAAMLAFSRHRITLCNIGDSKIFRFNNGVLEQISKDHVAISAFGAKPPLSQNLGIPPSSLEIDPYLAQGPYNNGDLFLICSDGLTDMVSVDDITSVLTSSESIRDAAQKLEKSALANGGRDNITIILCKVERKPGWLFNLKHSLIRKQKGE